MTAPRDEPVPEGWDELAAAFLDRTVDEAGRARLDALVASDPRCARELARAVLLHDAIARELTDGARGRSAARALAWTRTARRLAVAAALALAAGVGLWALVAERPAIAADAELRRLASAATGERREYLITARESDHPVGRRGAERIGDGASAADRHVDRRNGQRGGRPRPSLDGARLILGTRGSYVLDRTDADGARVLTGSDGATSWAVPAAGAVRVSRNAARFRGGLPGEQHDLPFVDPADGADELRRAYDVSLAPDRLEGGRRIRTIVATRRADAARGPRDVTIEYDADTALVLRMTLDRLPQAGGGPRSVTLDLVGGAPAQPGYFSHAAHHGPERAVLAED
jgi:hypothetical protein